MKITILHDWDGEWMAIYKDGELLDQGHSFTADDLLRMLPEIDYLSLDIKTPGDGVPYPERLKD